MKLKVYCDGLYEPRYRADGWSCWAWIAFDEEGKTVHEARGCLGRGRAKFSNNVAEYNAVGRAVRWLADNDHSAEVFTDSNLVVNQVNGVWACNAENLMPLCHRIQDLLATVEGVTLSWIPRAKNVVADALTQKAYAEARIGSVA